MRAQLPALVFGFLVVALLTPPALRAIADWRGERARDAFIAQHRQHADAAEAEGEFAVAETIREGAASLDPTDVSLRRELLLTRVRRAAADPDAIAPKERAELRYAVALLDQPDEPASLVVLGHLALAEGFIDAARDRYTRATELAPRNPDAWLGLAAIHRRAGETAEAMAACQKALEVSPRNVRALNAVGLQLLEARRPADALARFQAALEVRDDVQSHVNAADAEAALQRLPRALLHLQAAVRLAPKATEARRRLGLAALAQAQAAEAEGRGDEARELYWTYLENAMKGPAEEQRVRLAKDALARLSEPKRGHADPKAPLQPEGTPAQPADPADVAPGP